MNVALRPDIGHGVVPLVAGHAFRTLVSRAARAGNAVAGELVRLMEDMPAG